MMEIGGRLVSTESVPNPLGDSKMLGVLKL